MQQSLPVCLPRSITYPAGEWILESAEATAHVELWARNPQLSNDSNTQFRSFAICALGKRSSMTDARSRWDGRIMACPRFGSQATGRKPFAARAVSQTA